MGVCLLSRTNDRSEKDEKNIRTRYVLHWPRLSLESFCMHLPWLSAGQSLQIAKLTEIHRCMYIDSKQRSQI